MTVIEIEIKSGEEVLETLTRVLAEKKIQKGAIASIIGAVEECTVSTMKKTDAKENLFTDYHEPLELSGTGEINEGKPHIHAVLGREENVPIFGHLHRAVVKSWFVHVYILPMQN